MKSGSGRLGSTGIRRAGEAALFAAQSDWLMSREPGRCSWTTRKAMATIQPRQALEGLQRMALFAICSKTEVASRQEAV
ncbi:hypothetical protein QWY16_11980 [Planococcus shenhongbingii]|uniref:hypothetical protein n=1 Tax=Planococcus shenhongbingii TaxID=3058398 RepID=UPI00262367C1|nr:hypothetical protein [Planococcus sp. N016]WKA57218.1 hypothetical protein QWY16_11980 [Planococcus sp. N016]